MTVMTQVAPATCVLFFERNISRWGRFMTRHSSRTRHARKQSLFVDLAHICVIAACAVWTATLIVHERGLVPIYTSTSGDVVRIARNDAVIVRIRLDELPR